MLCIKTGALVYLDNYGEIVRGDLFAKDEFNGQPVIALLRVCERDVGGSFAHAFINRVDNWFDKAKTSGAQNSTLIGRMTSFDYEGL